LRIGKWTRHAGYPQQDYFVEKLGNIDGR